MAELSNTDYLLLGFLFHLPRSGYDIKFIADHSTRFFWQISYGQIYPELKRLTELGLVEPEPTPRGARARTLYRITEAGKAALREWLAAGGSESFEMRDELLLKLFFAAAADRDVQLAIIGKLRRRQQALLAELRAFESHAAEMAEKRGTLGIHILHTGLAIHQTYDDHLAELEEKLTVATS